MGRYFSLACQPWKYYFQRLGLLEAAGILTVLYDNSGGGAGGLFAPRLIPVTKDYFFDERLEISR
jgi:hypothetical protein